MSEDKTENDPPGAESGDTPGLGEVLDPVPLGGQPRPYLLADPEIHAAVEMLKRKGVTPAEAADAVRNFVI